MALTTQMRMLRGIAAILNGNGAGAFPEVGESKPTFLRTRECTPLPRSTPEAEGLDSAVLEGFYREVSAAPQTGAHTLLVLRHGKVVSEGYFAPYERGLWHVTHSMCKTVTGTAVGLAIDEGLFGLDDHVVDYFPDKTGLLLSRRMRAVTVRHLLTMSSGISYNEISEAVEPDWLRGIFASHVVFEPGSRFMYNSMNSYLLSALIYKTSGMGLVDYLRPRLFDPLGFGPVAFEKSAEGIEKGGWGMYLMAEDMAKLGQLYLQQGQWMVGGKTRQLLAADWVAMATSEQMRGDGGERYGFHLWLDGDESAYIMNGMFGQYVTVLPWLDMVLVMTSGCPYVFTDSPAHDIVRSTFYALNWLPRSRPDAPVSLAGLRRTLNALRFGRPVAAAQRRPTRVPAHTRAQRWNRLRHETVPTADVDEFLNTTWRFEKNQAGLLPVVVQVTNNNYSTGVQALQITREDTDTLLMLWEEDGNTICLPIGMRAPARGHITVGRDSFEVAAFAEVRHNEDGEAVLCAELNLLEHSSSRRIKFKRVAEGLQLRLCEEPDLMVAVQTVLAQTQNTAAPDAKSDPASSFLNLETVHRRVTRLCTPEVTGQPVKSIFAEAAVPEP